MKYRIIFIFLSLFAISCELNKKENPTQSNTLKDSATVQKFSQITVAEDSLSFGYTLITDNVDKQKADAKEIMQMARKWPIAMQKKDESLFNEVLAQGFTFREADGRLLNRDDYIRDRVQRKEEVTSTPQYENAVLQFIEEVALLTYRNIVKMKDIDGKPETWYMSRANIYRKENDKWKIATAHLIAEREEKNR